MNRRTYPVALLVLGVVLVSPRLVKAAVRYVALDGLGTTGTSWTSAYKSIQAAIDDPAVVAGDEIWVKYGTYPITSSIHVDKAVKIYGGYTGSGSSRSPATYVTTIDGQQRASHCFDVTANGVIDGFTLTNGSAFGYTPDDEGAGIYVDRSQATINNCILYRNHAGFIAGGISLNEADGTVISNCTFTENTATFAAGGLHIYDCSATVTGCTFQSNTTLGGERPGGALMNEYGASTITDCTFTGNSATYGAAVYNHFCTASFRNCSFYQNGQHGDPDRACLSGGAMYTYGGSATVSACLFTGNDVENYGGAIYDLSTSTFVNCIIWNNATWRAGGGVYVDAPEDMVDSNPHFVNCTISGNHAFKGGGVYSYNAAPTFRNCIVWSNTATDAGAGIWSVTSLWIDEAIANYCDIQGTGVYPGQGNINADPKFVAADAGDFHLASKSPCVDMGDNAAPAIDFEDYEGNPRIIDGDADAVSTVDMGAYEFQGLTAADMLYRGQIIQGLMYNGPSDQQPNHIFLLECQTAGAVASIQFRSPAGATYDIPSLPGTTAGEVQTYHRVDGDTHTWGYWGQFEDAATMDGYGDGTYRITVHYEDGSYHLTQVPFAIPGTSDPIVQPAQQPIVTEPAFGSDAGSPVTFQWLACSDASVDAIRLAVVDRNAGDPVLDEQWDTKQTSSGPHRMLESIYDVELTFANLYSIVDADATPFECGKVSVTRHQFETPYTAVYRFWSPVATRHFYTISDEERDGLIANYAHFWTYEGPVYNACATEYHAGLTPVYRFWSPVSGSHFYTINEAEKGSLIAKYGHVWTFEGVAFYAYPEGQAPVGTAPVHRFWKESDNTHFFTMNEAEKDWIISEWSHVYTYETIAFYAYP